MSIDREQQLGEEETLDAIRELSRRAASPNKKVARRAERELIQGLTEQDSFLPYLTSIVTLQGISIAAMDRDRIATAHETLSNVIGTILEHREDWQGVVVGGDDVIQRSAEKTFTQYNIIKENAQRAKMAGLSYAEFFEDFLPSFLSPSERPNTGLVTYAQTEADKNNPDDAWLRWRDGLVRTGKNDKKGVDIRADELSSTMKDQPVSDRREKLYRRKFAGQSLEDLEEIHFPLSRGEAARTTEYFAKLYKDIETNNDFTPLGVATDFLIASYEAGTSSREVKNPALLENIVSWQIQMYDVLLDEKNTPDKAVLHDLLKRLAPEFAGLFMENFKFLLFPPAVDVLENQHEPNIFNWRNPIATRIYEQYKTDKPEWQDRYFDNWELYYDRKFREDVVPKFANAIDKTPLHDETKRVLKQEIQPTIDPVVYVLTGIREYYNEKDPALIPKFDAAAPHFQEASAEMWDTMNDTLHFLPLENGVEVVQLDEDSMAGKLGVKKVHVNRFDTEEGWGINVRLDINYPYYITGWIGPDGKLQTTYPLEEMSPGLHALYEHVSILTCKDLTTQIAHQERFPTAVPKPSEKNAPAPKERTPTIVFGRIPRKEGTVHTQTQKVITHQLRPGTRQDPRVIGAHKIRMYGYDRFEQMANRFEPVVPIMDELLDNPDASPEVRAYMARWKETAEDLMQHARKKLRQPSQGKLFDWETGIEQESVNDPLTGEIVFKNSWVVEHTTPKLTDAELEQLVFFKRYYRATKGKDTALQTLDEFSSILEE